MLALCNHTSGFAGPNKHQSAVTCLQFNNKFVITSSDDGTVKLWDVKTGTIKEGFRWSKCAHLTAHIEEVSVYLKQCDFLQESLSETWFRSRVVAAEGWCGESAPTPLNSCAPSALGTARKRQNWWYSTLTSTTTIRRNELLPPSPFVTFKSIPYSWRKHKLEKNIACHLTKIASPVDVHRLSVF